MVIARIYIIRHGETDENRLGIMQGQLDTKLNAAGIEQAQLTANALEAVPFEKAFSSDLDRAVKTAETILKKHPNITLEKQDVLRERYLGDWQGTSLAGRASTAPANAEPLSDFTLRAARWWNNTILRYAESLQARESMQGKPAHVLVVSHGGYIGRLIANLIESGRVQCAQGLVLSKCWNASISMVELNRDGKGQLVTYSDTTHLNTNLVETNADVLER
ncbi:hypothetical protein AcV5_006513 [Taiwanofungus camphoratus]|nr:hypothetical protein AcW2_004954 [Antrodia cinnamomea]KAI0934780.1 hypothetical protein AcV5_006513 [Antrodia cinnamomea]KAI0949928.1 hypothetical protein AcV7_008554 [Antrodia cinnamomea]